MKKLFLSVALASAVAFVNAQDMTSKKGVPILPEAGDWSIGFDATSLIQYFGNLANGNANNTNSSLSPQVPFTLVGLYVVDENTAYRGKLRIGFGSTTTDNLVNQDGSTSNPPATVSDERKTSGMNITIGAGLQKMRGKGRLKGIYGGELAVMLGSGKTDYTYGNAFSTTNQTPNSTDWATLTAGPVASRTTENKAGSTFGIQLNGFIGAEFFFAPKMSLSAEYGWGLVLNSTGEGEQTTESWNITSNSAQSTTSKTGKASSFSLDVMNAGAIVFHCYF